MLDPEQYRILRQKGTEAPFSGEYDHVFEPGQYHCAGCGAELFASEAKFDSGCGWPAFSAPLSSEEAIIEEIGHAATGWSAPRCCAPPAAGTSGTCSTTGRRRAAPATASTRPRCGSSEAWSEPADAAASSRRSGRRHHGCR